jgi:hypothetical protein
MVAQRYERNTWRDLSDEELRHYRQLYRRMRANLPDDVADPALRASTEQYLAHLLTEIRAEIDWRRRAAARGVPIEGSRFTDEFKDDLKARVNLDAMLEFDLDARIGKVNAQGWRNGHCPFCGHRDCFGVYVGEPTRQCFSCFSCGVKGDAITLLQHAYGGSFHLAVEKLAAMCGVPLPDAPPPPPSQRRYLDLARGAGADA